MHLRPDLSFFKIIRKSLTKFWRNHVWKVIYKFPFSFWSDQKHGRQRQFLFLICWNFKHHLVCYSWLNSKRTVSKFKPFNFNIVFITGELVLCCMEYGVWWPGFIKSVSERKVGVCGILWWKHRVSLNLGLAHILIVCIGEFC